MSAQRPKWAPKRLMDLVGVEVMTRREMQNSYVSIPVGTRVKIDNATAWHKINIVGSSCECCGVKPVMARVHIDDLRPLPEHHVTTAK